MRRWLLGACLALGACAQRDNPWDPVNMAAASVSVKPPQPSATSKVVLPDSASRDPDNPYYANLASAIAGLEAGDTLWIQGNRDYVLTEGLQMSFGGSRYSWIVIRSFGGAAHLVDGSSGAVSALLTLTGSGWVELRGLGFSRSHGAGFRANGLQGPLRLDSCVFDSNATYGIETRSIQDSTHLRSLRFRANGTEPPLFINTAFDSVDVRFE